MNMKTTDRVTQAELARRLKISRASICKAVKAGRITPDDEGLFDPVEAELQWLANSRPKATAGAGRGKSAGSGYAQARARKEDALARMAELRLAQALGEVVPMEAAEFAMHDLGATVRGHLENLPDRLAPLIAHPSNLAEARRILVEAMDEVLTNMSKALARRAKELAQAGR